MNVYSVPSASEMAAQRHVPACRQHVERVASRQRSARKPQVVGVVGVG